MTENDMCQARERAEAGRLIGGLTHALESILFEDSDKSESRRLLDRVKARMILEEALAYCRAEPPASPLWTRETISEDLRALKASPVSQGEVGGTPSEVSHPDEPSLDTLMRGAVGAIKAVMPEEKPQ